jgi:hypothetical protein
MAIINAVNEVLHRIRVKPYPNYLTHVEDAYIARTDNEASLSIGVDFSVFLGNAKVSGAVFTCVNKVYQRGFRVCINFQEVLV